MNEEEEFKEINLPLAYNHAEKINFYKNISNSIVTHQTQGS